MSSTGSSADTPGAGVGGLGGGGAGSTSRKSFASKNLNALTKAPAVHRSADRHGEVVRPAYGAGGRLLVLGNKNRDGGAAAGSLSTPVPVNTPSLRRENKGQDISVPLVPSGGIGWGANKAAPPPPTHKAPSPAEGSAAPSNDIRTPPGGVPSQAQSRTEIGKQTPEAKTYQPQQQQSSPKQQRPGGPGYGRVNEREFPLGIRGTPKVSTEKPQQLRPRGGMNSDAPGTRSSGLNLGASGSPSSSHYPRHGPAGAPPIAHRMGNRGSSGGGRLGPGVGYNSSGNINHNGGSFGHHGVRGSSGLGGGGWESNRGRSHLERDRQPVSPSLSSAVSARKWERDRDRDRDRDGGGGPELEWGGRESSFRSPEKARHSPDSGGMSKTVDDEEARRKRAKAVAEEARAFAERERRLAERSDEVEKGVALRARMELERLRAEKEQRPKQQQQQKHQEDGEEKESATGAPAADLGYEPGRYGRDDPYRGEEELERLRAAQQAAIAALSPALPPAPSTHEHRSVADWSLETSSTAPKSRAPPKVVLARGQEEAVEAETGVPVIQKRQVPPSAVVRVAPHDDEGAPKKPLEQHGKGSDEARAEKVRRETSSSVSLQWLTPRKESGGEQQQQHQPQPHQHQQQQQQSKESGRSFSSLFVGPGRPSLGGSGMAGGGVVHQENHWLEAGRGTHPPHSSYQPPPAPSREHKRIFDHKTGKMRDVEESDMSSRTDTATSAAGAGPAATAGTGASVATTETPPKPEVSSSTRLLNPSTHHKDSDGAHEGASGGARWVRGGCDEEEAPRQERRDFHGNICDGGGRDGSSWGGKRNMDYGNRDRSIKSWERGFRKDDHRYGSRGIGSSREPREHGGKMPMQHDLSRRRPLDEPSPADAQTDSGVQDSGEAGAVASHASNATAVDGAGKSSQQQSHQSSNALEDPKTLKADDEREKVAEDLGPTTFADVDREREASDGWGATQAHGWGDSGSVCNQISDQKGQCQWAGREGSDQPHREKQDGRENQGQQEQKESREMDEERKREEDAQARREARRRESTARPPRTSGALYRRLGDGTYVNADVEDGEADPMQAQWTAMTEASERGNDHDHDRFSRHSRRKDAAHFSSNSRGGVSSRDSFPDSTVRRNYPAPPTVAVGGAHDSAALVSGGARGKKGGPSEAEAAVIELEREAKAREDREKLKEARKERKKMKRGGWDEGSRDIDGEAKKGTGSKLVTSETEATLTPGMVVVNENDDTLGINTAPFDTAEFEVVKSRRELQKERKEQRDMEERAAALRAQREAAAARKAAQQAAREQRQAQRELARAEARKAEVQRRSEAARAKEDKDASNVKAPAAAPAEATPSIPETTSETPQQDIKREVEAASRAGGVERMEEVQSSASSDAPNQPSPPRKPATSPSPTRALSPLPIIQFGDVVMDYDEHVNIGSRGEGDKVRGMVRAPDETTQARTGLQTPAKKETSAATGGTAADGNPQDLSRGVGPGRDADIPGNSSTAAVSAPVSEPLPSSTPAVAVPEEMSSSKQNSDAPVTSDSSAPPGVSAVVQAKCVPGSGTAPRSHKAGGSAAGDVSNQASPPVPSQAEVATADAQSHAKSQAKTPPPQRHGTSPTTKGLLNSPSLAGSVPIVPHVNSSWQPLPVGMTTAATVVHGVPSSGIISNGVMRNSGSIVETSAAAWGGAGGVASSQAKSGQRDWAPVRLATANISAPSVGQAQRGNNPVQGGLMGMVGTANGVSSSGTINGNSGSARGRLMSGPNSDGFAVSTGIAQGIHPPQHQLQSSAVYSGIAPRPTSMGLAAAAAAAAAVAASNGSREVTGGVSSSNSNIKLSGGHGNDSNHQAPAGLGTAAAATAAQPLVGSIAGSGSFGGFVLGYHPPGSVRQLVPGGPTWGGAGAGTAAGFPLGGGGSPGGVGGGLSPPGSQHPAHSPQARSPVLQPQPTQLQQQQQQLFYGSFAGGAAAAQGSTAGLVTSGAQRLTGSAAWAGAAAAAAASMKHSVTSTTTTAPTVTVSGVSSSLADAGNSSGLAAEAPPFIPSANPPMWGVAAPRPQHQQGSGIVAPSQLANPMLVNPTMSPGTRFGAGGIPMGLGMRGGVLPGTVHGMLGRPPPPPAMIANQQMQQQQVQQPQQLQHQQLQHQHQQHQLLQLQHQPQQLQAQQLQHQQLQQLVQQQPHWPVNTFPQAQPTGLPRGPQLGPPSTGHNHLNTPQQLAAVSSRGISNMSVLNSAMTGGSMHRVPRPQNAARPNGPFDGQRGQGNGSVVPVDNTGAHAMPREHSRGQVQGQAQSQDKESSGGEGGGVASAGGLPTSAALPAAGS